MDRAIRLAVQRDTIKIFEKLSYTTTDNTTIQLSPTVIENCVKSTNLLDSKTIEKTFLKSLNDKKEADVKKEVDAKIIIYNGDCLKVGLALVDVGHNPLELNMASYKQPGGGYLNGAGAQEENIFRRSCMYLCLDGANRKNFYPIPLYSLVLTSKCVIIKDTEESKYALLPEPKLIDIILVAAVKAQKSDYVYDKDDYPWLSASAAQTMYNKIDLIFKTAIINKNDSVVLSAFGCGAYSCPPYHVSKIFNKCIQDNNYQKYFSYIVFAILDDVNAIRNWGGNLKYFEVEFNTKVVTDYDFTK
jgi:uncharacterized protein (TIGR02452 family)